MNITEKLRLQQVKRYPICHTNRDQSVAEHSYNVAIIAADLAKAYSIPKFRAECIEYALHHDMEEVYTGDIPSSFKRHLLEQVPAAKPLVSDPTQVDLRVKNVVKLADYLEAIHFLREFGGSRQAKLVLADIESNFKAKLEEMDVPIQITQRARDLWGQM